MAVTGVWLGPGGGAAGALAGGVAAAAVSMPVAVASAASVDGVVEEGVLSMSAGAAEASAACGPGTDLAIESIADSAGISCGTASFFLKTGFLTGFAAGFAADLAGGAATIAGALISIGGGKEILRVTKAGTRLEAGYCTWPKRVGGRRSTSA